MPGSPAASVANVTVATTPSPLNPGAPRNAASTVPGCGESTTPPALAATAPGSRPSGRTLEASHASHTESPFTTPSPLNAGAPRNAASTVPGCGESTTPPALAATAPGSRPSGRTLEASHASRTESPFTTPVPRRAIAQRSVSPSTACPEDSSVSVLPSAMLAGGCTRGRGPAPGAGEPVAHGRRGAERGPPRGAEGSPAGAGGARGAARGRGPGGGGAGAGGGGAGGHRSR